jgi:hypothetical protein
LFQFSNTTFTFRKDAATAFFAAASQPKQIKRYDVSHQLNTEQALNDRRDWLTRQLRLR